MRSDNHMDCTQMECNTCAEHQLHKYWIELIDRRPEYIYVILLVRQIEAAHKLPRPSHSASSGWLRGNCLHRYQVQSTPRLWQLHINQSINQSIKARSRFKIQTQPATNNTKTKMTCALWVPGLVNIFWVEVVESGEASQTVNAMRSWSNWTICMGSNQTKIMNKCNQSKLFVSNQINE